MAVGAHQPSATFGALLFFAELVAAPAERVCEIADVARECERATL